MKLPLVPGLDDIGDAAVGELLEQPASAARRQERVSVLFIAVILEVGGMRQRRS
jgi:hypothetical protein